MSVTTLTSKGQVTIPKRVREQLHLRTGDKLDFRVEADGTLRVYPLVVRVADAFGAFAHKSDRAISDAEIQEGLREAFREGRH
jgi:AbrB family looped-hinge helix DNA binding protein